MSVSYSALVSTLESAGERFAVLSVDSSARLVITQRGGRIFPFVDEGECVFWINPALGDAERYKAFHESGDWNMGGERMWIAPQIQYGVADRNDFWGTLSVPRAFDPGRYQISKRVGAVTLTMPSFTLTAHNLARGEQQLSIERHIAPVTDPLTRTARFADLTRGVQFFGYRQSVMLSGVWTTAYSEAWNLVQLNAGGRLYIPCLPEIEASDYFGDVPEEVRAVRRESGMPHVRINITGEHMFKVGYQALCMTGRMGYINTLPDGRAYLLVRSFANDPSNVYAEEPPTEVGNNGQSVFVYNDDGKQGAFGEMECCGKTVRGGLREHAHDEFTLWGYVGRAESIHSIASALLGIKV